MAQPTGLSLEQVYITWIVYKILLKGSATEGKHLTSCNKLSIQCDPPDYLIVIKDTNASSNLHQTVLEECNGHYKCYVEKPNNNCVHIKYWCRYHFPMLDITKSPITELKENVSLLGFTSENYLQGEYQDAENIDCNLTVKEEHHNEIHFIINEFTPLVETTQFCLYEKSSPFPLFCSGSFETQHGPIGIQEKYQFSIRPANTKTHIPKIRFWIDIQGSEEVKTMYHITCQVDYPAKPRSTSNEDMNDKRSPSADYNIYKNTALILSIGALLGVVALGITCLIGRPIYRCCRFYCSSKTSNNSGQYADIADENNYMYIDVASMDSGENLNCNVVVAPDVPKALRETASVNLSKEGTSSKKEEAHDREVSGIPTSPKLLDNIALMTDNESMNVKVQVHAEHDPLDENDDAIVNECTSLSTMEASADGARKDSEYILMGCLSSNINGKTADNPPESPTSDEPHDYLELTGDPENPDLMEAKDTDPSQIEGCTGNEGASKEHPDYLELMEDPDESEGMNTEMEDNAEWDSGQNERNTLDGNTLADCNDYLEPIGETDVANQVDENYSSIVNEYTSLNAMEASGNTQDAYTSLSEVQ